MKNSHTKIVGILNITPDSFSDGGDYFDHGKALSEIEIMTEAGAAVVDIGAESTRPGAIPMTHKEEWKRLQPVLNVLGKKKPNIEISIDTYHHETATKAIKLGVDWINDVSGFSNKAMLDTVASSNVMVVLMHSLSVPADKNVTLPKNVDPVATILTWAYEKIQEMNAAGISKNRIIFDPGIGFGKTKEQSLQIIQNIEKFQQLGTKIMVGHSRKSFLALFTDEQAKDRDYETFAISAYLALKKIDYIRVHNVAGNARVINTFSSFNEK